jgi:hypothetical protein
MKRRKFITLFGGAVAACRSRRARSRPEKFIGLAFWLASANETVLPMKSRSKNSVGMPGKVPLTTSWASSDSSHQKWCP